MASRSASLYTYVVRKVVSAPEGVAGILARESTMHQMDPQSTNSQLQSPAYLLTFALHTRLVNNFPCQIFQDCLVDEYRSQKSLQHPPTYTLLCGRTIFLPHVELILPRRFLPLTRYSLDWTASPHVLFSAMQFLQLTSHPFKEVPTPYPVTPTIQQNRVVRASLPCI